MKQQLFHLPLESYSSRYTDYMATIEDKRFSELFSVHTVSPDNLGVSADIQAGRVLDRIQRPRWSMAQISRLLEYNSTDLGKVYLSDFYTTGLDAIAYSGKQGRLYSFLWAQTFDCYDFTAQEHMNWMRPWEVMAFSIYRKVFVACPMLKELIVAALPAADPIVEVVGLPFDSAHVRSLLDPALCPSEEFDVVYSSRWDKEKQPHFFLEVLRQNPNMRFAVCTGRTELTGTDARSVKMALDLEKAGRLTIFRGCSKAQYLAVLSRSKVQFNCALQDWVSFTLLEGLTMGCQPLYPAFRSFPDALYHSESNLYAPFNLASANAKLKALVNRETMFNYRDAVLQYHDAALTRIANIIEQD